MTHRIKGCKTTADENRIFNKKRKPKKKLRKERSDAGKKRYRG